MYLPLHLHLRLHLSLVSLYFPLLSALCSLLFFSLLLLFSFSSLSLLFLFSLHTENCLSCDETSSSPWACIGDDADLGSAAEICSHSETSPKLTGLLIYKGQKQCALLPAVCAG